MYEMSGLTCETVVFTGIVSRHGETRPAVSYIPPVERTPGLWNRGGDGGGVEGV